MRIGVDATCWSNRRGYGRFARALLTATLAADRANEYVFLTDLPADEFPMPAGVEVVRVSAAVPTIQAAAANGRRSLADMWALSRAISARRFDLFFFPSVYSYVPLGGSTPELVTIHDVIPELFPALVFPTRRSRLFWRAKVSVALMRARRVVTISEYSRQKISEVLGIRPDRLRIVNEAGDPVFRRLSGLDTGPLHQRLGVAPGTPLVAYVGGFSPHKNLVALIGWFRAACERAALPSAKLVLVGDYETDPFFSCYPEVQRQVVKHQLQGRVLFPGYMKDDDLLALFHAARALVLPSFCEGFGLPAVEAAACGAPVVVTTESPLPALLGEGAIAVSPHDDSAWVAALARVLSDEALRQKMSATGLAATAQLSWENSARQLLDVFHEVAHVAAA
jgi:alpha-1,3-rhamnosyl/mannosyltransferase